MQNGYTITCKCGRVIDDFSLADEWWCECGESGILQWDEEEAEEAENEREDGERR